jgi:hypothetical protein
MFVSRPVTTLPPRLMQSLFCGGVLDGLVIARRRPIAHDLVPPLLLFLDALEAFVEKDVLKSKRNLLASGYLLICHLTAMTPRRGSSSSTSFICCRVGKVYIFSIMAVMIRLDRPPAC